MTLTVKGPWLQLGGDVVLHSFQNQEALDRKSIALKAKCRQAQIIEGTRSSAQALLTYAKPYNVWIGILTLTNHIICNSHLLVDDPVDDVKRNHWLIHVTSAQGNATRSIDVLDNP